MRAISVFGLERVPALTAAEAAAIDRNAREDHGIADRVLMESAGRATAELVQRLFPDGVVLGLVGSGHNGGDALVALRTLQAWGREVAWIAASDRLPNAELLHGHDLYRLEEASAADLLVADVLLDGILGTGAQGAPRGRAAELIEAMNASGKPIVALDLPSGVDATSGRVEGVAVRADVTVTFGAPKRGLLFHPAREYCGRLIGVEIGFPPLEEFAAELITPEWAWLRLPERAPNAHKGTSGRLLVFAGSHGMAGAAALSSLAAVRSGAGLVRIASVEDNRAILQTVVPEATFFDANGEWPVDGVTAVLAGPGLGRDPHTRGRLDQLFEATGDVPLLLDADALNLLSEDRGALARIAAKRPVVITPHVRELGRLWGRDEDELLADPVGAARAFSDETGAVVLFKGLPSVVAAPGEPVLINTSGSSDTAAAGMGDQLSGIIAGFLAAGLDARDAAGSGLYFSGRAADLARRGRSLTPRDVATVLSEAFRSPDRKHPPFGLPFITFDQSPRW